MQRLRHIAQREAVRNLGCGPEQQTWRPSRHGADERFRARPRRRHPPARRRERRPGARDSPATSARGYVAREQRSSDRVREQQRRTLAVERLDAPRLGLQKLTGPSRPTRPHLRLPAEDRDIGAEPRVLRTFQRLGEQHDGAFRPSSDPQRLPPPRTAGVPDCRNYARAARRARTPAPQSMSAPRLRASEAICDNVAAMSSSVPTQASARCHADSSSSPTRANASASTACAARRSGAAVEAAMTLRSSA